MRANAIKLSASTIKSIVSWLPTEEDIAKFAFACLTSAYDGKSWYYIEPDTYVSSKVDYTKQIMTEEKLKTEWSYRPPQDDNQWFRITKN